MKSETWFRRLTWVISIGAVLYVIIRGKYSYEAYPEFWYNKLWETLYPYTKDWKGPSSWFEMGQFLFAITAYLLTPFLATWGIYFVAKWIAKSLLRRNA